MWGGASPVSTLGGNRMSQRVPHPQSADPQENEQRLRQLLNGALDLADSLALPPEIGARLQEVIDQVESHLGPEAAGK